MDKTIILVLLPELLVKLELMQENAFIDNESKIYKVVFTNMETQKTVIKARSTDLNEIIEDFDEILQQRQRLLIV